jgi:hypothetical protein
MCDIFLGQMLQILVHMAAKIKQKPKRSAPHQKLLDKII